MFFIVQLLLLPQYVLSAQLCQLYFVRPNFAITNPTASLSWAEYTQPNQRGLIEYNYIIGVDKKWQLNSLEDFVPAQGVAIDVGGGYGRAYQGLAAKKNIKAVVINTQEHPELLEDFGADRDFFYHRGWAQEVLPRYREQADLVTDIWGAFSYEINKVEILELVLASLKPGGRAFILYHPVKTPALVKLPGGEKVHLDEWLEAEFPEVFHSYYTPDWFNHGAKIIAVTKPLASSPIHLPLALNEGKLIRSERNVVPESVFVLKH